METPSSDVNSPDRVPPWPVGWYDDPWNPDDQRYYDGGDWTGYVRTRTGAAASGQPAAAADTAQPAAAADTAQPAAAADTAQPAADDASRRRSIYLAVGGGVVALVLFVFVSGWLAEIVSEDAPGVASSEGGQDERSWDELLTPTCGFPGAEDYVLQARCIMDIVGAPGPTDDRALATVFRDSCNSPSVAATDMPYRLAEVTPNTPSESIVAMVLTVRLARVYCGEGESLDYDGFRSGP